MQKKFEKIPRNVESDFDQCFLMKFEKWKEMAKVTTDQGPVSQNFLLT